MKTSLSRRQFVAASSFGVGAMGLGLPTAPLWAQESFPSKTVKIIVPLPAGGTADSSIRIFGEQFQAITKQSMVVDNKPGGLFQIGLQALAQAPADGYTLLHLNIGMASVQAVNKKYDLLKQVAPVALMGVTDGVMAAAPNAPFKTTKEMVAWAKANPGKLNYGTVGLGSIEHLTMAGFAKKHGFTATSVPFKGGPDAMTALIQGEIHIFTTVLPLVYQFLSKGVRTLAVMVDKRSPLMPDVMTMKEQGLDVPNLQYWGGLAAPMGTPKAVIEAMHAHITSVMNMPALKTKYMALGMVPSSDGSEAFAKLINSDLKWMSAVAQDLDLKLG